MVFQDIANIGKSISEIKRVKPKTEEDMRKEVIDSVLSAIETRQSIRSYKRTPVSFSIIEKLLEAASKAPSAGNHQPWEFIVVTDRKMKKDIAEACFSQYWMLEAPVFIIVCINQRLAGAVYGERGTELYGMQSVAAAIENMLLAATAYGLGTCWVGSFSEPEISALTHCPDYVRPCAIITLGYANEVPEKTSRQALTEIVHYEEFGKTERMRKSVPH